MGWLVDDPLPVLAAGHHAIVRIYEAQNVARKLFDNIGIGEFARQQGHVAIKLGAHGLEAFDLKL